MPVPIFINGVEAHTVVRDLLTTEHEQRRRAAGVIEIDSLRPDAAVVDAVAGPASYYSPRSPCVFSPRFLSSNGISGHTTPGSEGSLHGRFHWAPSGSLNGGFTVGV